MKKVAMTLCLMASFSLAASLAMGGKSSVEYGKKLFNDPTLGGSTNSKSCNSCHPDGKGLEKAGDKENLSQMINSCIEKPLKGTRIDGRSVEMRSLKMYIESLKK